MRHALSVANVKVTSLRYFLGDTGSSDSPDEACEFEVNVYIILQGAIEDVDAQINQDALTALKQLLESQPQLHNILFSSVEHKTGMLPSRRPQSMQHFCCLTQQYIHHHSTMEARP